MLGIQLLEGKDVSEDLKQLSASTATAVGKLGKISSAASSVLWSDLGSTSKMINICSLMYLNCFSRECSKFSSKDQQQNMILDLLVHSGISSGIASCFSKVE